MKTLFKVFVGAILIVFVTLIAFITVENSHNWSNEIEYWIRAQKAKKDITVSCTEKCVYDSLYDSEWYSVYLEVKNNSNENIDITLEKYISKEVFYIPDYDKMGMYRVSKGETKTIKVDVYIYEGVSQEEFTKALKESELKYKFMIYDEYDDIYMGSYCGNISG